MLLLRVLFLPVLLLLLLLLLAAVQRDHGRACGAQVSRGASQQCVWGGNNKGKGA
jgi:hypothetical protein